MRVNIYGEELTNKVELTKKTVDQRLFVGARLYLKSSPDLHHSVDDNDESAITIWVPWTKKYGNQYHVVIDLLRDLTRMLEDEDRRSNLNNGV